MMARKRAAGAVAPGLVGLDTVRKFAFSARAREDTRPVLQCGYADGARLVSADGFRLHVASFPSIEARWSVETAEGLVAVDEKGAEAARAGWRFPNFDAIIPDHGAADCVRLFVHREELRALVGTAEVFARDNNYSTRFDWDSTSGILTVSGCSSERGSVSSAMPAPADTSYAAERGIAFALSARYVLDALSGLQSERVTLVFRNDRSPVLFLDTVQTEVGAVDLLALIMPMSTPDGNGPVVDSYLDMSAAARELCAVEHHVWRGRGKVKNGARMNTSVGARSDHSGGIARLLTTEPGPGDPAALVWHDGTGRYLAARSVAVHPGIDYAARLVALNALLLRLYDVQWACAQAARALPTQEARESAMGNIGARIDRVYAAYARYTSALHNTSPVAAAAAVVVADPAYNTLPADQFVGELDDRPVLPSPIVRARIVWKHRAGRLIDQRLARTRVRAMVGADDKPADVCPLPELEPINPPTFDDLINGLTFDDLARMMGEKIARVTLSRVHDRMVQIGREMRAAERIILSEIEAARSVPGSVPAPGLVGPADTDYLPLADKPADVCDPAINPPTFGPDWSAWGDFWDAAPLPDLEDTQPMPVVGGECPDPDPEDDPPAPSGGGSDVTSSPLHTVGVTIRPEADPYGRPAWYAYRTADGIPLYLGGRSPEEVIARLGACYGAITVEHPPTDPPTEIALRNAKESEGVGGLEDKPADVCPVDPPINPDTFGFMAGDDLRITNRHGTYFETVHKVNRCTIKTVNSFGQNCTRRIDNLEGIAIIAGVPNREPTETFAVLRGDRLFNVDNDGTFSIPESGSVSAEPEPVPEPINAPTLDLNALAADFFRAYAEAEARKLDRLRLQRQRTSPGVVGALAALDDQIAEAVSAGVAALRDLRAADPELYQAIEDYAQMHSRFNAVLRDCIAWAEQLSIAQSADQARHDYGEAVRALRDLETAGQHERAPYWTLRRACRAFRFEDSQVILWHMVERVQRARKDTQKRLGIRIKPDPIEHYA